MNCLRLRHIPDNRFGVLVGSQPSIKKYSINKISGFVPKRLRKVLKPNWLKTKITKTFFPISPDGLLRELTELGLIKKINLSD